MPLVTYEQTRPWAGKIAAAVDMKMMPPWFADPRYGHFANDPSLTAEQMRRLGPGQRLERPPETSAMRPRRRSGPRVGIFRSRMWW
jgi:hypothetical protein